MKIDRLLLKLPEDVRDVAGLAAAAAEESGGRIFLVGGCVRDLLLKADNFDLDFVVEGDGIKTAQRLAASLNAEMVQHRRFGTAAIVSQGIKIDVATARTETYPVPASLPVVKPGTLEGDLYRRDFTINAMAVSINGVDFGQLVDSFGGRQDLRGGKIRVLHNASFIDDPTRILRAARFEQRYGFRIEPATLALLKNAARSGMLNAVHPHRLRDELLLILKERSPYKPLSRLQRSAGMDFLHPRISLGSQERGLFGKVPVRAEWFVRRLPHRRRPEIWVVYLMALLDGLTAAQSVEFCRKFGLRRGDEKRVLSVKQMNKAQLDKLHSAAGRPSEIYSILEPLSYEAILFLSVKHGNKPFRKNIEDFLCLYNGMPIHINGRDIHQLGCGPGPLYRRIFSAVLEARLNGEVHNKHDELELARGIIRKSTRTGSAGVSQQGQRSERSKSK
ncbi:MAG: hypothetical protein WBE75_01530 [Candidatus Omnitrophota bacterium]